MDVQNVYVVEDDTRLRLLVERALESLPEVRVLGFGRAEEALEAFAARPPALLVTDLGLTGMTGVELIAVSRVLCPRLPVVVTTGNRCFFRRELADYTFAEIWEKPFSVLGLRARVEILLRTLSAAHSEAFAPFGLLDYLHMASLGDDDLVLRVQVGDGRAATVEIVMGEIWGCRLGELEGLEALRATLACPDPRLELQPLQRPLETRQIDVPTERILIDLAVSLPVTDLALLHGSGPVCAPMA
jgi:DNA-binding response OmpR family regulator